MEFLYLVLCVLVCDEQDGRQRGTETQEDGGEDDLKLVGYPADGWMRLAYSLDSSDGLPDGLSQAAHARGLQVCS